MNILYISKLDKNTWRGPAKSVPSQILAQKNYDNVFWFNMTNKTHKKWREYAFYHDFNDYSKLSLNKLPKPFDYPDLVIFEGVYEYPFLKLIYDLWKSEIPYIVVPRSALTKEAQQKKQIKKFIANQLFFNQFIKKAIAIHYLTENELEQSTLKWNKNYFIVPNGIDKKHLYRNFNNDCKESIKGIFIGRIDTYQKGLDLLLNVCEKIKENLREHNCQIELYGPDYDNSKKHLQLFIEEKKIQDIISLHNGVFEREKEGIQLEADFFIMTSRFEGHPMGLIEALSYGLPCLVTTGTNMKKEVLEFDAGWGAENSIQSIEDQFLILLSEKDKFSQKGKNAKRLADNYDWDIVAYKTKKEYERIIKGLILRRRE